MVWMQLLIHQHWHFSLLQDCTVWHGSKQWRKKTKGLVNTKLWHRTEVQFLLASMKLVYFKMWDLCFSITKGVCVCVWNKLSGTVVDLNRAHKSSVTLPHAHFNHCKDTPSQTYTQLYIVQSSRGIQPKGSFLGFWPTDPLRTDI